MRYYLFYDNNEEVIGYLATPGTCYSKNAKEVNRETYDEYGGVSQSMSLDTEETPDPVSNKLDELLDAIIQ